MIKNWVRGTAAVKLVLLLVAFISAFALPEDPGIVAINEYLEVAYGTPLSGAGDSWALIVWFSVGICVFGGSVAALVGFLLQREWAGYPYIVAWLAAFVFVWLWPPQVDSISVLDALDSVLGGLLLGFWLPKDVRRLWVLHPAVSSEIPSGGDEKGESGGDSATDTVLADG